MSMVVISYPTGATNMVDDLMMSTIEIEKSTGAIDPRARRRRARIG
jgi:hypothetical protein